MLVGMEVAWASTLGWTAPLTQISNEVRNVGLILVGLAITLAGCAVIFRRHLGELGDTLSSIGVGGALVVSGPTIAAALLGIAAAQPLLGAVALPSVVETMGTLAGGALAHGGLMAGVLWVRRWWSQWWRRG
jgi:TrbC/VIRB2 pilin